MAKKYAAIQAPSYSQKYVQSTLRSSSWLTRVVPKMAKKLVIVVDRGILQKVATNMIRAVLIL